MRLISDWRPSNAWNGQQEVDLAVLQEYHCRLCTHAQMCSVGGGPDVLDQPPQNSGEGAQT
jgi:hypothetical protein